MKLKLIYEGNPILRQTSKPVENITKSIKKLVADMFETMYADNGIGLAAPQIAKKKRVIIIDLQTKKSKPITLINPEIISSRGETESEEGCLSCPGLTAVVKRAADVVAQGYDMNGNLIEIKAEGLLAIALQHEIDHLNGILFIDRLTPTVRIKVEKQRTKML